MSDITNAVLAAMNVDQSAVQGSTKGISTAQFMVPDASGDRFAYDAYKSAQMGAGLRPIPFQQWKVMFSGPRQQF